MNTINPQILSKSLYFNISESCHVEKRTRAFAACAAYDEAGRSPDGKVLDVPTNSDRDKFYIRFMVGECPGIPHNPDSCDYLLRFSSKVSGHLTTPTKPYISGVHEIAKKYFGRRVHLWHELWETEDERQLGCYNWQEVHDADRKLRELETGQEQRPQEHALEERVLEADKPKTHGTTT